MSAQHLESDSDVPDLESYSTPDKSNRDGGKLPDADDQNDQDDSWAKVNEKLKSGTVASDDDEANELEMLKAELAKERQEKATFEKRMKDSQRAFKDKTEELKRLREEQESLKKTTTKLKEDVASGDIAAPQNQKDIKSLAKEYGLTQDEMEFFEIYPEGMNAIEKILAKRMETGLSERERQKEMAEKEARAKQLESEIAIEEESKWMKGVKAQHKDAEKLIDSAEFKTWTEANGALLKTILASKQKYDPSGLVEIIDHYKEQKAEIERVRAKRQFNRQASVTPSTVNVQADDSKKELSWAQINANLKKQKSR